MERIRDYSLWPQRMMAAPGIPTTAAPYARVLAAVEEAEHNEGWLVRCDEAGRYLALSAPFVEALAATLRSLGEAPVLEVCAGNGALAAALRECGVAVTATDVCPPTDAVAPIEPLAADEALRRFRPRVVLGSFVPADAGVDRRVLDSAYVRHYLVLNARLGGVCGAPDLWTRAGWARTPLEEVSRWMVCRHDVWLGPGIPLLSHGEAWWFHRAECDNIENGERVRGEP